MSLPPYPDISGPTPEGLPSVAEVGALLRARTQDDNDQELGTFTDRTRPTGQEVERLIAQAANVVYNSTGDLSGLTCSTADQIRDGAKYMMSLLAACLIELSYFPEQVRSNRSAYQEYYDILTSETVGMPALVQAAMECRSGEVEPGGGAGEGTTRASWAFPVDLGGMVGWQTKW